MGIVQNKKIKTPEEILKRVKQINFYNKMLNEAKEVRKVSSIEVDQFSLSYPKL